MAYFKNKIRRIDAWRFTGPASAPLGSMPPTIKGIVWKSFGSDTDLIPTVTTIQGQSVKVSPGEWIIDEGDGVHFYPCDNMKFLMSYEPIQEGQ